MNCGLPCYCTVCSVCMCAEVQDEIAFNRNCCFHRHGSTLKIQVAGSCTMIIPFHQTARYHNPENHLASLHRQKHLDSLIISVYLYPHYCPFCDGDNLLVIGKMFVWLKFVSGKALDITRRKVLLT